MEGLDRFSRHASVVFTEAKFELAGIFECTHRRFDSGYSGIGGRREWDRHPRCEREGVRSLLGNGIPETAEESTKRIGAQVAGDGFETRVRINIAWRNCGRTFGCDCQSSVARGDEI